MTAWQYRYTLKNEYNNEQKKFKYIALLLITPTSSFTIVEAGCRYVKRREVHYR